MNETSVLTDLIPVRHLFETHLTVSDLQRSIRFYRDVIGLRLAFKASEQNGKYRWRSGNVWVAG
jgi:catechol 2,3-dioxygenase-like lactoylglutathione lyase family enzyme